MGKTQEEFAASIGMQRPNYARMESGKQNPTIEQISEIVRNYNTSYDFVFDGVEKIAPNPAPNVAPKGSLQLLPRVIRMSADDRELVPMVPVKAAAGYLNGFSDPEYIGNLPTLDIPGLSGQTHRAFEIRGSSMMPTHHPGSIAIGRWVESFDEIQDRRVYIVITKYDGIVLKRVINRAKQEGKLILMSDNSNKHEYPNYPVEASEVLEIWYWRGGIIREIPEPGAVYTRINDLEGRLTMLEHRLNTH